jgi:hypothetical protein
VIVEDKHHILEITAKREQGSSLAVPVFGEMSSKVNEALKSKIFVKFTAKNDNSAVFSGTGRNSGLEFVGDINELLRGLGK